MNSSFQDYLISRETKEHYTLDVLSFHRSIYVYRYFPNNKPLWNKHINEIYYELEFHLRQNESCYGIHKSFEDNFTSICYGIKHVAIYPDKGYINFGSDTISEDRNEALELFNQLLKYSDSIR